MSPQELLDLWASSGSDDGSKRHHILNADDYFDGWEVADDDDWTQDHKYQHIAKVIKHTESGRCFCVNASRSGSYHTNWYYSYDDLTEVKAVEEVIKVTKWVTV